MRRYNDTNRDIAEGMHRDRAKKEMLSGAG